MSVIIVTFSNSPKVTKEGIEKVCVGGVTMVMSSCF